MQLRSAVIAGASGLVGGHCLQALLASPHFSRVVALVRRPLPSAHVKLVQQVTDNFEALRLDPMPECAVFCCLGSTIAKAGSRDAFRKIDYDMPLALARAAKAAGASTYSLVSSVDADPNSRNFYLRVKGDLEAALRAMNWPALHLFQPSFLLGERREKRPAEAIGGAIASSIGFALRGRLERYRPIEAEAVAKRMVQAAGEPSTGTRVFHWREIR